MKKFKDFLYEETKNDTWTCPNCKKVNNVKIYNDGICPRCNHNLFKGKYGSVQAMWDEYFKNKNKVGK